MGRAVPGKRKGAIHPQATARARAVPTIRTCPACGHEFEGRGPFCDDCVKAAGLARDL